MFGSGACMCVCVCVDYHGIPIAIYEDYAPEVMEQRKYRAVLEKLYNVGLKPALLFHARLSIVTREGGRKKLSWVMVAKEYIASLGSQVT